MSVPNLPELPKVERYVPGLVVMSTTELSGSVILTKADWANPFPDTVTRLPTLALPCDNVIDGIAADAFWFLLFTDWIDCGILGIGVDSNLTPEINADMEITATTIATKISTLFLFMNYDINGQSVKFYVYLVYVIIV